MKARIILLVFALTLGLPACSNASSSTAVQESASNVAKVKVTRDGHLYLNGAETTIDVLKQEFARLASVQGEVWYYRESPDQEPSPIAEDVMNAVIEARLPVQFSENDFT